MKKEIETNKENYVKELQKLIQINKNRFLKSLENTREGMILINEKECFVFGNKDNIEALIGMLAIRLFNDKVMTENELVNAIKHGIEFASFEKEMKKDKEFANKVKDLLKSIEKFMED